MEDSTSTAPAAAPSGDPLGQRRKVAVSYRNIRLMHFLDAVAERFHHADVPLMVLKGGALNLTLYDRPDERAMCDLDLLIREQDIARAFELLEQCGAYRSQVLLRDDFFPKYYYEAEFTAGSLMPVVMDVHVRPFRPLRYSRFVPDDAMWQRAQSVRIGDAPVMVPSPEDMLIHLAVHYAIHGGTGGKWRQDIRLWIERHVDSLDWDYIVDTIRHWRLSLPMLAGLAAVYGKAASPVPAAAIERMRAIAVNWRDRLALAQAPRDDDHPVAHMLVNCLTTPGVGYVRGYLASVLLPGRAHMHEWYAHEHTGWLALAHLSRWTRPVTKHLRFLWTWMTKCEIARMPCGELGIRATRSVRPGQTVGVFKVKAATGDERHSIRQIMPDGSTRQLTMRGPLRFVRTDTHPNARVEGTRIVAIKRIKPGDEICIDIGRTARAASQKRAAA